MSNPGLKPKKDQFSDIFSLFWGFGGYPPGGQHPGLTTSLGEASWVRQVEWDEGGKLNAVSEGR